LLDTLINRRFLCKFAPFLFAINLFMESSIKKIDELILKQYDSDSESYLNKLAYLIEEIEEIEEKVSYNNYLFNTENEKYTQRLIAICFMRILANYNAKHLEKVRHQIFKLIQNALPDICLLLSITDKTETYQQESILIDFIKKLEKEYNEKLYFNGEISTLNSFQQTYRRTVNSKKSIVLQIFIGNLANKPVLDKIFCKINEYIDAKDEDKYKIYSSVNEILEQEIEDAKTIGTEYAVKFISNPFSQIKEALLKDIEKSPFFIPVYLKLNKTEKKYPLKAGIRSSFNLEIFKEGKGYAQNTYV
ncbi:hypothetical protein EZS27_039272, partial [termite gut metagenome]